MSTTSLDRTVVSKLQQFSRRRFRIILLRGLCAGVVAFAVSMSIVAIVDWGWVLSDTVRRGLSALAYFATAVCVWAVCGRKLVTKSAQEEVASQFETAEPKLREQLLAAVELATDAPEEIDDSPVFRSLLQGNVAGQMAKVQVESLLPVKLMAKWLLAAMFVVAAIALLMTTGGPRFRSLAARAILPMANIDRVSRINVEILQPTPHSLMIAKDETVAIVVRTSGGNVEEAILETYVAGEPPIQQAMTARADSEFAANLHIEDDAVEYRIMAGDAVTRRYTINGRSRPRVVSFEKSYDFPDYSGKPDLNIVEEHGDILVLEGTEARINVELDQEVSEAELRIDVSNSDDVLSVPLEKNTDGKWSAIVPVDRDAIYMVHLVSLETGFENRFSPRYEIRPLPDLLPRAGFVGQQETNLLLPPGDILALKGMAEDDLPLQTLEQEISVNGRDWVSAPLEVEAVSLSNADEFNASPPEVVAHRINAEWNWDLLGLELKTGDQVTTRLVATDLKGNRGESFPLRIVVSSPDFDPDRHATMETRAKLIGSLERFANVAAEHKSTALEIVKTLQDEAKQPPESWRADAELALDCTTLRNIANKLRESATNALQEVQATTKLMPAGIHAYELDLAGRVLAKTINSHVARSVHSVAAFQNSTDAKDRKQMAGRLKESFDRSAEDAKSLAYHYRHLVSQDIFSAFAWDFHAILRHQSLVANSPTQTFPRLRRQETLVVNQLQTVERLAKTHRSDVPDFLQNHLDQIVEFSDRWIARLEQSMESEDDLPKLQKDVQDLHRELRGRQRYDAIDGGMANRLTQARRDLDYRSGSLVEPLSLMSTATHEETRRLIAASEADDSQKAALVNAQALRLAQEVDLKLRPSIGQLRARRILSQARVDSDTQFAADVGMTHRATNSLMNQHRQGDPQESIVPTGFREIAPAYRILEAGHDVANVQGLLDTLIASERWNSMEIIAISQHPRQWDAVQKGLEEAVKKMRQAGIKNEIVGQIDPLRWSSTVRDIGRKIGERRWKRDQVVSATEDLTNFRSQLDAATIELLPVMSEARTIIAKYAPTIPDMAQQIAGQVRQMQSDTTAAADAVEEVADEDQTQSAESPQELANLDTQQEQINQQIDDLFEALVEDANQQDLMQESERERARDADDSVALIQEPAQQMNQALQESKEAATPVQQAETLAEAAEHQEKTAQALELVAQHFNNLESGQDVAESREQLRSSEREMGLARQMDQRFQDTTPLEQMVASTPDKSLMELLEDELQNNSAMREALSEISQNTVEESRNALLDAANQDKELQKANERSDKDFRQKKKELAEELKQLARGASDLTNRLVAQAESAASQAKTPEAKTNFQDTRQQLQQAASSASKSNESDLLEQLATNAVQTSEALKNAAETLRKATEQSAAADEKEIHADEKMRQKAKQNLENQRKRFVDQLKREADQQVKQRTSEERRATANVRNSENNVKKFERDLQQAEKRAEKKPDDRTAQRQIQQAESRKLQAEQQAAAARKTQENAKQNVTVARQERETLNAFPQTPLEKKNPAAQLAGSLGEEAKAKADQLMKKAEELLKKSDFGEELSPEQQQLANAAEEQQRVKDNVDQVGENLARASRHERRLNHEPASAALQQSADTVQNVAENEATEAKQQLKVAESAAADAQSAGDTEKPDFNNKPALAANAALQKSEQAIREQADALSSIVDASDAAQAAELEANTAPSTEASPANDGSAERDTSSSDAASVAKATSSGAESSDAATAASGGSSKQTQSPTDEERALGKQLAQALDELDRAQASLDSGESLSGSHPADRKSASGQLPASLVEAAKAKAAQLAQQRSLGQQQNRMGPDSKSFNPDGMPQTEGPTADFLVKDVNRIEQSDWGKLREKEADELTKGRREAVSADYRKSVEAYFKVLAERARRRDAN